MKQKFPSQSVLWESHERLLSQTCITGFMCVRFLVGKQDEESVKSLRGDNKARKI
jgi:hypothetical protein